jgi:transcriptional regulator with XRE-family HTH domain
VPRLTNETLKSARVNAGLTQAELAKAVGISRQRLNQYERLRHQPSPQMGERIATVLGVMLRKELTYTDLFPLQQDAA